MKIAELFRVDGQVALVTGGASGLGYACAQVLADNGTKVCILDRDAARLNEAKAQLSAVTPDVMAGQDGASMRKAAANVIDRFQRLDIAFINAGIGGGPGSSTRVATANGNIIVTTSVAALKPENFVCTAHLAAKAGAAHLVRQVALELARYNMPWRPARSSLESAEAEWRTRRCKSALPPNPMGRMATPDEIQGLALFLASSRQAT